MNVRGDARLGETSILGISARARRDLVSYVPQDPLFCPGWRGMRLRQFLEHSLQLRLRCRDDAFVEATLGAIDLRDRSSALLDVLSGGERKRVSTIVGVFMSTALLMCVDEPTSGLSTADSLRLMVLLAAWTRRAPCVLLASIHQPSASVYELFDQLLLLKNGYAVFSGARDDAESSFDKPTQLKRRPSTTANAAESILALVAAMTPSQVVEANKAVAAATPADLRRGSPSRVNAGTVLCPSFGEMVLVIGRMTKTVLTSRTLILYSTVDTLRTVLVTGWILGRPENSVQGGYTRYYAVLSGSAGLDPIPALLVWYVSTWHKDAMMEVRAGLYGLPAHLTALFVASTLRAIVVSIPIFTLYFWMCDFRFKEWPVTTIYQVLDINVMGWFALVCVVATVSATQSALYIAVFGVATDILRGGVFSKNIMRAWAKGLVDYVPTRWAIDGAATAQLSGMKFKCSGNETLVLNCPVKGRDILSTFDYGNTSVETHATMFSTYLAVCVLTAFFVLSRHELGWWHFQRRDAIERLEGDIAHSARSQHPESQDAKVIAEAVPSTPTKSCAPTSRSGGPLPARVSINRQPSRVAMLRDGSRLSFLERDRSRLKLMLPTNRHFRALRITQLTVRSPQGIPLLRALSATIDSGRFTALIGNSGAGTASIQYVVRMIVALQAKARCCALCPGTRRRHRKRQDLLISCLRHQRCCAQQRGPILRWSSKTRNW